VNGEHPDRDDLVAFALGALDRREEQVVEAHVPGCARCTRELEALVPAVAVLGESVEQHEAPPELRDRVMAAVYADIEPVADGREPGERRERRRERRGWRAWLLRPATGLAALAIVAAGVGGYLVASDGDGGPGETTVPVVAQKGIGGTLEVGDTASVLDLHGLDQLSGREVYQVWIAKGQSLRPSSDFVPDGNGRATTAVDAQLASGTKVMVTREPEPGRSTPTPPILLSATVQ
jgi:hypothetical protein